MKLSLNVCLIFLATVLITYFAGTVLADSSYDEGTSGDLADDRLNPTRLTLSPGSNVLTATSVFGDLEYVTMTVPDGFQIEALMLVSYVSTNVQSFIAVQSGTTFTEPPIGTVEANLLGYTHFGTGLGQVGTDILDDIAVGAGAIGFTPPLTNSNYTFWLQETGPASSNYTLNFIVSPITSTSLHDEATNGDLSDDRLNPTNLALVAGGNLLTATSVLSDLEYVTIAVPPDFQLDAILLESYLSTDDQAFIAAQSGITFTESATNPVVSNLLGYTHFGTAANQVQTDILDDMAGGDGAIGFAPPLLAGDYTFWLQETGAAPATYTLNLVLSDADIRYYFPVIMKMN